jgi:hypothetical protein
MRPDSKSRVNVQHKECPSATRKTCLLLQFRNGNLLLFLGRNNSDANSLHGTFQLARFVKGSDVGQGADCATANERDGKGLVAGESVKKRFEDSSVLCK